MPSEKDKFISNCISECRKKGTPQDQAVAICHSKWRKKGKSIIVKNLISNLFKWSKIRKILSSNNGGDALIPENLAGMKKKGKK